jgi:hypothetical protein
MSGMNHYESLKAIITFIIILVSGLDSRSIFGRTNSLLSLDATPTA